MKYLKPFHQESRYVICIILNFKGSKIVGIEIENNNEDVEQQIQLSGTGFGCPH